MVVWGSVGFVGFYGSEGYVDWLSPAPSIPQLLFAPVFDARPLISRLIAIVLSAWGRCPWSVLACMRHAVGVIGPLSSEDQSFGLSTILICCYAFPAEARPYCLIGVN
ncbi:unnamed protein product [Penicillium camemberti]|uniref:Str. FM013 n=1 Tax=Penicillium camemberti (strain FM 013) TaxID=1429867 RepID=A0A0G4PPA7_PENC3|nr:unnamed protein product [Penicillium camemberti]